MTFDCAICGKECRDNYNLERHMTNKHLGGGSAGGGKAAVDFSVELKDPRGMSKEEEDEYLFNHPYYREKDGKLYATKLKELELLKNYELKKNWKLKSAKQIGIDRRKIDEEYGIASDEELDETSEAFEERYKKRKVLEYEGSWEEFNKIQEVIDTYMSNVIEYNKILEVERQQKVKSFVRTKIINEIEARKAAEEAEKRKADLEAAKLERIKKEIELKMEMAMLKYKK